MPQLFTGNLQFVAENGHTVESSDQGKITHSFGVCHKRRGDRGESSLFLFNPVSTIGLFTIRKHGSRSCSIFDDVSFEKDATGEEEEAFVEPWLAEKERRM